jgi:phosphatidylserine/phosphatidylglycerophosphate/cardiolipin synthase-like enzyme
VALALLCALSSPPTQAALDGVEPAALVLSEWSPIAPPGTSESAGEWIEFLVEQPGTTEGWAVTDNDGDVDFTFPDIRADAGERIVLVNGRSASGGAEGAGHVLYMNKTGWTWENTGDDVVLLGPGGAPAARWTFGGGSAIDGEPTDLAGASVAFDVPPAGATLAAVEGASGAARPTPEGENALLSRSPWQGLVVARLLWDGGPAGIAVCNERTSTFESFGWSIADDNASVAFDGDPLTPGACVGWARPLPAAVLAGGAGPGSPGAVRWTESDSVPGDPEAGTLRAVDPWGSVEALVDGMPPVEEGPLAAHWWIPCACDGGWRPEPLEPFGALGVERTISAVSVVPAGEPLGAAFDAFADAALEALSVNAYALTDAGAADALVRAAGRGVAVRLLVEPRPVGWGEREGALSDSARAALEAAGVQVRAFAAGGLSPARDHAKYAVADDDQIMVLTENLVGSALGGSPSNTGYALLGRSSGLAADLLDVFDWDFGVAGGPPTEPPTRAAPSPGQRDEGPATARLVVSPSGVALPVWVDLIDAAHGRVQLESLSADPDVLGPTGPVGQALLRAASRGVAVEVLLAPDAEGETSGSAGVLLAAAAGALHLPLEVRHDPRSPASPTKLHAKALVADGSAFILGSHNMVEAAFATNREVSVVVVDAQTATQLAAALSADFARGVALAPDPVALVEGATVGQPPAGAAQAPVLPSLSAALLAGAGLSIALAVWPRSTPRRRRRGKDLKGRAEPAVGEAEEEEATPPNPPPAFVLRVAPAARALPELEPWPLPPEVRLPPSAADRLEDV